MKYSILNTLENPFIVDVSLYQTIVNEKGDIIRHIDWEKAYRRGVRVAILRATIGNYRIDKSCAENYKACLSLGIIPTFYHVMTPEYPAQAQAKYLIDNIPGAPLLPIVIDNELVRKCNRQKITSCTQKLVQLLEEYEGRKPIMYTSQGFWDMWVMPWSGWKNYPLFVAWYPWQLKEAYNNPFPIRRCPRDWIINKNGKRVAEHKLWQASADGNGKGREYGVWSGDIDLSFYNGSIEDFESFFDVIIPDKEYMPYIEQIEIETDDKIRMRMPLQEFETMRSHYQIGNLSYNYFKNKGLSIEDFMEIEEKKGL